MGMKSEFGKTKKKNLKTKDQWTSMKCKTWYTGGFVRQFSIDKFFILFAETVQPQYRLIFDSLANVSM